MSDRGETQDFMSVDTFSQLPFISRRNAPSSRIRLFGFDFPPHASESNNNRSSIAATSARGSEVITGSTSTATAAAATKDAGKKFECQYCFRNFPTSQALGGHQNAHKRERQYAKRAYLAESHLNHQIDNQRIMGLSASSAAWFSFHHTRPPPHYPSWSLAGSGMAGGEGNFYAGLGPLGSMAPPINSRPVLGQLRSQVPAPQMTLFQGEDRRMTSGGGAASWSPSSSSSYTSTWQGEWHSLEPKDGVTSLDLRL